MISQAFHCAISQIYQCTEGFLAISDKYSNRLTLNEEFLIIEKEWLDEKRFVPIITDLMRTTQPIVRYRLDDVLMVNDAPSVFTQLDGIEGRVGDICYGQQGVKIIPLFADSLRQHMVNSRISFDDYRIVQLDLNEFSIQITPDVSKEHLLEHLNQFFKQKQCTSPNWHWDTYQKQSFDVKCRRIYSKYTPISKGTKAYSDI